MENYRSWFYFLSTVRAGDCVYYQAPLDASPRLVRVDRIFKNDKVRIGPMSNQADKFTADAGHLSRFLRKTAA